VIKVIYDRSVCETQRVFAEKPLLDHLDHPSRPAERAAGVAAAPPSRERAHR